MFNIVLIQLLATLTMVVIVTIAMIFGLNKEIGNRLLLLIMGVSIGMVLCYFILDSQGVLM